MVLYATLFTDLFAAFYPVPGQTSFIIYNELLVKTLQKTRIGAALQTEQDRFLHFPP